MTSSSSGAILDSMYIYAYHQSMEFTCNPIKNETNIRERGLLLLAARAMFTGEMLVREDTRKPYPERRFIGYGALAGRLMVVVFCQPDDEHIHIISFRKANPREQKKLENKKC